MKNFYSSRHKPLNYKAIDGIAYLDKVVSIDQSPIGKTPRSNPATYTGIFGHIRDLYSQLPDSKVMGYKPGRFSFNVKGGRCEHCQGAGLIKIEMHFLSDVYITCEHCKGKRFNAQTLQIKYKLAFMHGEKIRLQSRFSIEKKSRNSSASDGRECNLVRAQLQRDNPSPNQL